MLPTNAIVIRTASEADAGVLHRLAALDESRPPRGRALLAEVDGVGRAALGLDDGWVVADPFVPTASLVALLRLRAQLLAGGPAPSRAARLRRILRRGAQRRVPAGA